MQQVEIRMKGHLDESWGDWLEGFTFTYTDLQETILSGKVADQSALYGIIAKLRDLGVMLVAVEVRAAMES